MRTSNDKPEASGRVVRPVHANRGVTARYRKALLRLIDEMHRSILYWVRAAYRRAPPVLASDALPSDDMQRELEELGDRWIERFEREGERLARFYVERMFGASDRAFREALKDAGFAVQFVMTKAMKDALSAKIEENVALIRSIPEEYLKKVERAVMGAYAMGRDLERLTAELKAIYPITERRARFIALDQSNKANAVVIKARQQELGIKQAIWQHSHAGKQPRPDHVAAHGRVYNVDEGCLISGEYIYPGELPRCRCTCKTILPLNPSE